MQWLRGACSASLFALVACTGSPREPAPALEPQVDALGWMTTLAIDPAAFDAVVDPARPGWVAMHAHDYEAAYRAFDGQPVARARAAYAQAVLHDDLARVVDAAERRLFDEWVARGGLPEGASAAVAGWAAWCGGREVPEAIAGTPHPLLVALAAGDDPWKLAVHESDDRILARLALHQQARAGTVQPLIERAQQPVMSEVATGFDRHHFDPCLDRSLSTGWLWRAREAVHPGASDWKVMAELADDGLAAALFAPWLDAAALSTAVAAAGAPGLVASDPEHDAPFDAQTVEGIRAFHERWEAHRAALEGQAAVPGRALLDALDPVGRYRQERLIVAARAALQSGEPRQALALLDRARDVTERDLGPRNAPSLFALTALAQIELGHTREALDALQPLAARLASVKAAQEVVGDLAVIQGIDRRGDSKENP